MVGAPYSGGEKHALYVVHERGRIVDGQDADAGMDERIRASPVFRVARW
jgi:hypothetical protein